MWGNERQLDDYLRGRLKGALDELARMPPDDLLRENCDVIVASLLARHLPVEVVVDWGGATRGPVEETTTRVRDMFDRGDFTVPASRVVVSIPASGTTEMLDYQSSSFSLGPNLGKVTRAEVVVEVIDRELTADRIRGEIAQVRKDVDQRASWANTDLARFRLAAEPELRNALTSRRARILNDRAVEEAIGIPIHTSTDPRPPVPARRKHVGLQIRRAQSQFVPEPVLEEATYQDILDVVRAWANTMERTPRTSNKLDEEELRDLLLGTLNGYWQGAAGGELFNGSGKTDITVREGDRNAFIAECKIWHGPRAVAGALDQLLSYLVWRDSKTALIMFIKTSDPARTIDKLHAAVEGHDRHALTKEAANPRDRADYIFTADEEGRRVALAVVPVIIRPPENKDSSVTLPADASRD